MARLMIFILDISWIYFSKAMTYKIEVQIGMKHVVLWNCGTHDAHIPYTKFV